MDIPRVKRYTCIVCRKARIFERMVEHTHEGEVPDVNNCDLSQYSHHQVVGGKLLANRPHVNWDFIPALLTELKDIELDKTYPLGGICDSCLKDDVIDMLVKGKNIKFATEEELKRSLHSW